MLEESGIESSSYRQERISGLWHHSKKKAKKEGTGSGEENTPAEKNQFRVNPTRKRKFANRERDRGRFPRMKRHRKS